MINTAAVEDIDKDKEETAEKRRGIRQTNLPEEGRAKLTQ
jgi:hypothetical protein